MKRLSPEVLADYDARILAALREKGPMKFGAMCEALGVDPRAKGKSPVWRIVDRRLQALSYKGLVRCPFSGVGGGRWMVREVKP